MLGRLTFNPIPHIDPWMSILFPALLWFGSRPSRIAVYLRSGETGTGQSAEVPELQEGRHHRLVRRVS